MTRPGQRFRVRIARRAIAHRALLVCLQAALKRGDRGRIGEAVRVEPWARDFSQDAGPLVQIRGDPTPPGDQYRALAFIFEHGALMLECNEDTDEIIVEPHERDLSTLQDVSDDEPFEPLVGKYIEHLWWMTNHRGYQDGFQMRLLDLGDRSESTLQFEVAASALYVRAVG